MTSSEPGCPMRRSLRPYGRTILVSWRDSWGVSSDHDARSCQCRNVTNGYAYRLHLGQVRIVVRGGVCLTTLPAGRN